VYAHQSENDVLLSSVAPIAPHWFARRVWDPELDELREQKGLPQVTSAMRESCALYIMCAAAKTSQAVEWFLSLERVFAQSRRAPVEPHINALRTLIESMSALPSVELNDSDPLLVRVTKEVASLFSAAHVSVNNTT